MSRVCLAWCGVSLFLATISSSRAGEAVYYAFELDGKPIGSSEIIVDELTLDGQTLQRLRSTTTLKFALLGTTRTTTRRATTLVHSETGVPSYYDLTQDNNGAVTHVECKFAGDKVQTWQWAEGASKGDPKELSLPAATRILGSNDFSHWGLLTRSATAQAKDGAAELTVFLPDVGQTQTLRLVLGASQKLDAAGTTHECRIWQLEGAGIDVLVDAQSGRLVRMNIPAQKTTVTLSDAKVAQHAQQAPVAEILAQHFAQSNIAFEDFLKVRSLKAVIDVSVIGSAVGQDASVLRTSMQEFQGERKGSTIRGTVTVRSVPFAGSQNIPFPAAEPAGPDMAVWLKAEPLIESDDAGIAALARDLTKGATHRWAAVSAIAQWVHKEIRYAIADSPSARLALEKRVGDCGPHATLTVAMLRAAGIPARLVGGLVYAPAFGGSFGQHAWVEAHLGADGWVAFDPTTGELDSMSATHIKLFEGMGGVIPTKVEVQAYEPVNRELAAAAVGPARPVSWDVDKNYTYTYVLNGQKLGTEVFRLQKSQPAGQDGLELTSTLDLTTQGAKIHSVTRLVAQSDAIPRLFHRDFDVNGTKTTSHCEFGPEAVKVTISGATALSRDIAIKTGTYCFDNNLLASFALICSQLDLKENQKIELRTFHPSSMSVISLSFQFQGRKNTQVSGKEVECFECFVEPIKNTFWITPAGRLVKIEAKGLVVEVSP